MRRVLRSSRAERDLDDIWDYVAGRDVGAAERLLDRMREKLDRLAAYPRMGRAQPKLGGTLRSFTVPPYILLYQPIPDGIRLIRVLHGARDLPAALDTD